MNEMNKPKLGPGSPKYRAILDGHGRWIIQDLIESRGYYWYQFKQTVADEAAARQELFRLKELDRQTEEGNRKANTVVKEIY